MLYNFCYANKPETIYINEDMNTKILLLHIYLTPKHALCSLLCFVYLNCCSFQITVCFKNLRSIYIKIPF